ncbi:MAG: phosphotransferase [Lentisphaerae bacterium]|nr:phosphotransferase [Lentisphaerota bacterium]
MIDKKELPLRVTHNDTKINNVMVDHVTGDGVCVIDLDTVMPGSILYDFGDMVRTTARTGTEDDRNLDRVTIDLKMFEQIVHGYLLTAGSFLTPLELEYLAFSGILITYTIGIRFLTDHLAGDTYFKIHRENHNLERARVQFKMIKDMEKSFDEMKKIVERA